MSAVRDRAFVSRQSRLEAMNTALDRELVRLAQSIGTTETALLTEMVSYHLGLRQDAARPGKRMRANLALLTCEAMGHRYADAVWAAVAVELVHNFSLVFDDVQDGDPLRRGRPSLWKVWGADQAINAGAALEALVTSAVVELLPARHQDRLRPALALLTTAMIGLCRGQVLDLQFEQRVDVTLEEYLAMVALKTAGLFECAARLGALAAGAGAVAADRAGKFGRELGIAYQIIDDVTGIWGTEAEMGKPVGSDLRNGKKTLPAIIALSRGPASGRRRLRSLLTRATFTPPELDAARTILAQANARTLCFRQAVDHLAEARLHLFAMSDRPNWALRALAEMVLTLESGLGRPVS